MSGDTATATLGRAIDFLFVEDRPATSMGGLFGAFVLFLTKVFDPIIRQQHITDFSRIPPYLFVIVGIFLFNLPRFFRGDLLPRHAEARLKIVREELRAKRLSREEGHTLYKRVLEEELIALLGERQLNIPRRPRQRRVGAA